MALGQSLDSFSKKLDAASQRRWVLWDGRESNRRAGIPAVSDPSVTRCDAVAIVALIEDALRARQHLEVRSVAIDGVFPPSLAGGVAAWTSAGEGINAVFKACRDQAPCRKRYGDIGATFRRLVIQYEASPKTVKLQVPGNSGKVNVKISGGMLVQWAVSPGTHVAAKVPASIYALADDAHFLRFQSPS